VHIGDTVHDVRSNCTMCRRWENARCAKLHDVQTLGTLLSLICHEPVINLSLLKFLYVLANAAAPPFHILGKLGSSAVWFAFTGMSVMPSVQWRMQHGSASIK
jgi:hypothetical protein